MSDCRFTGREDGSVTRVIVPTQRHFQPPRPLNLQSLGRPPRRPKRGFTYTQHFRHPRPLNLQSLGRPPSPRPVNLQSLRCPSLRPERDFTCTTTFSAPSNFKSAITRVNPIPATLKSTIARATPAPPRTRFYLHNDIVGPLDHQICNHSGDPHPRDP